MRKSKPSDSGVSTRLPICRACCVLPDTAVQIVCMELATGCDLDTSGVTVLTCNSETCATAPGMLAYSEIALLTF